MIRYHCQNTVLITKMIPYQYFGKYMAAWYSTVPYCIGMRLEAVHVDIIPFPPKCKEYRKHHSDALNSDSRALAEGSHTTDTSFRYSHAPLNDVVVPAVSAGSRYLILMTSVHVDDVT